MVRVARRSRSGRLDSTLISSAVGRSEGGISPYSQYPNRCCRQLAHMKVLGLFAAPYSAKVNATSLSPPPNSARTLERGIRVEVLNCVEALLNLGQPAERVADPLPEETLACGAIH